MVGLFREFSRCLGLRKLPGTEEVLGVNPLLLWSLLSVLLSLSPLALGPSCIISLQEHEDQWTTFVSCALVESKKIRQTSMMISEEINKKFYSRSFNL